MLQREEKSNLWIQFEYRAVEDREASLKANRAIYKQIEYYKVTLPGGKEVREGEVNELIQERYQDQYQEWKMLNETPMAGTPLKNWALMPIHLQYEAQALGIKTMEALVDAKLDEAEMPSLCYYQERALEWFCQADEVNILKKELNRLKLENQNLKQHLKKEA